MTTYDPTAAARLIAKTREDAQLLTAFREFGDSHLIRTANGTTYGTHAVVVAMERLAATADQLEAATDRLGKAEAELAQRTNVAIAAAVLRVRGDISDESKTRLVNQAYDAKRNAEDGLTLNDSELTELCCGFEFIAEELILAGRTIDREREDLKELRQRCQRLDDERRELVGALRNVSPERTERAIQTAAAQARDAERAACAAELEALRTTMASQSSEIAELRASKRKLRDALERTKAKR